MARRKLPKLHQIKMSDGSTVMTYDDALAEIAAEKAAEGGTGSAETPVQTSGMDAEPETPVQTSGTDAEPETAIQTSGMDAGAETPTMEDMPVTGLAITTSATTITLPENLELKDSVLLDYTRRIASTINSTVLYVDEKNREIARMLGDISLNKRYTADGFKSVAEYAEKFFGYRKSAAYMLASAGEVYLDASASEELKAFSPYKLAEFSKVDKSLLDAAAKSGSIKPSDTVKDLREKARTMKAETGEGEVQQLYTVSLRTSLSPMWNMVPENQPIFDAAKAALKVEDLLMVNSFAVISKVPADTVEAIIERIKKLIVWKNPKGVIVTSLPKIKVKTGKGKKAVSRETLRALIGDGETYMVLHFDEWKAPEPEKEEKKPEPEKKRRFTVEELKAMLEEEMRLAEEEEEEQPEEIELEEPEEEA